MIHQVVPDSFLTCSSVAPVCVRACVRERHILKCYQLFNRYLHVFQCLRGAVTYLHGASFCNDPAEADFQFEGDTVHAAVA